MESAKVRCQVFSPHCSLFLIVIFFSLRLLSSPKTDYRKGKAPEIEWHYSTALHELFFTPIDPSGTPEQE